MIFILHLNLNDHNMTSIPEILQRLNMMLPSPFDPIPLQGKIIQMQGSNGKYIAHSHHPSTVSPNRHTPRPSPRTPSLSPNPLSPSTSYKHSNNSSSNTLYSDKINEVTHRDFAQLRNKYPIVRIKAPDGASQQRLKEEALRHLGKHKSKNSVTYAEQLRLTLLEQYQTIKHHKKTITQKKSNNKNKSAQGLVHSNTIDVMEGENREGQGAASPAPNLIFPPSPTHYAYSTSPHLPSNHSQMLPCSKEAMAYRTLNTLYQTIIDSSLQHRKKENFQLQARQLPIVDRFTRKHQQSQIEDSFYIERSLMTGHRRKPALNMGSAHSRPVPPFKRVGDLRARHPKAQRPEQYQILPWGFEQQRREFSSRGELY